MQYVSKLIIVLLILISAGLSAQEIEPFGSFQWSNGLNEVVEELNAMGVDAVVAGREPFTLEADTPIGQQLEEKLREKLDGKLAFSIRDFITASGETARYYNESIRFEADGISIYGIPFSMVITLSPFPGFAVEHPEKALKAPETGVYFAHVLTDITLSTTSPTIEENGRKIFEALAEKYPEGNNGYRVNDSGVQAGRFLISNPGVASIAASISYHPTRSENEMMVKYAYNGRNLYSQVYNKHIADKEASAQTKDHSRAL